MEKMIVKTSDIVNSNLWRLFPAINVDRCKDIPSDYPGAMGVPATFMDKIGRNDGYSGFVLLDMCRPQANGKQFFQRLIIRNLYPELPEAVDLMELLEKCGVMVDVEIIC